ncbi:calcium/sodium antiporter [bacterium]|nr:calcium/sodium antiporter [bacterium]
MELDIVLFILGFILLIKGADVMVDGSSSIAKKYGVSSFFIGLTIVAFGTSAPELIVSLIASIKGISGIALGNIIGSNMSNTLLVLGICAVITPLLVKKATIGKEIPLSLLAIVAVGILANDYFFENINRNGLTRIDGLMLILFFSIFIYYTFGITREKENIIQKRVSDIIDEQPKQYSNLFSGLMIVSGLGALTLGGHWIVNGGIAIATSFGVSEAFIGLTIVALGTSLPELAASGMAAYKGKTDMAIGNVVGSNIFNLLWVLGLSSVIKEIAYNPILNIDVIMLFGVTVLLLFLIYFGKKNILGRNEGMVLIALYVAYLAYLVMRG